jgi:hypothetical protein
MANQRPCTCLDDIARMVDQIRCESHESGQLELRIVQLESLVDQLIKHIDTWAHSIHRAYHAGPDGYFACTLPACIASAHLVRLTEKH